MMLLVKFDYDQPADLEIFMFESVNRRTGGQMDGRPLESHPISLPTAFGSGELKNLRVGLPLAILSGSAHGFNIFQRQLSRIEFTLNYLPIRNNLTL